MLGAQTSRLPAFSQARLFFFSEKRCSFYFQALMPQNKIPELSETPHFGVLATKPVEGTGDIRLFYSHRSPLTHGNLRNSSLIQCL